MSNNVTETAVNHLLGCIANIADSIPEVTSDDLASSPLSSESCHKVLLVQHHLREIRQACSGPDCIERVPGLSDILDREKLGRTFDTLARMVGQERDPMRHARLELMMLFTGCLYEVMGVGADRLDGYGFYVPLGGMLSMQLAAEYPTREGMTEFVAEAVAFAMRCGFGTSDLKGKVDDEQQSDHG